MRAYETSTTGDKEIHDELSVIWVNSRKKVWGKQKL